MIKLPTFFTRGKKEYKIKPVVLLVLDGFGLAPPSPGNAIAQAKTPNYLKYLATYPHGQLIASGESVGLPANEVGNTEVGHLNMGAGRVIYQDLKRISMSIEARYFFENRAFTEAANYVRKNNSKLHLMGLVGSGCVHSSIDHFFALMQFCKKEQLKEVYFHLFTDGRDAPPNEAVDIFAKIESQISSMGVGKVASVSGRYYAMDRDRRWDRTKKAYDAIVLGCGVQASSSDEAIKNAYAKGQSDEFIEPTVIQNGGKPVALVDSNDAIIFFNFRADRPRQLSMAFLVPDFESMHSYNFGYDPETSREVGKVVFSQTFKREKVPQNIFFVSMTEYTKGLSVNAVAFKNEVVEEPLSVVLSQSSIAQMHMTESEKERFVTYYFDGLREEPQPLSEVKIVSSPKVATYDKKPEMALPKLFNAFKKELNRDKFHFFVMNFANPDMVGHSGNLKATIKAVECVDKYIGQVVDEVLLHDGMVLMTADHGNAEELATYPTSTFFYTTSHGTVNTDHSNNPVPILIIGNKFTNNPTNLGTGILADVAPTILGLMKIQKPEVMTGKNLVANVVSISSGQP